MKYAKALITLFLGLIIFSCGNDVKNPNNLFSIEIDGNKKGYPNTETLKVRVISKKGNIIDDVTFTLGDDQIETTGNSKVSFDLSKQKIGEKNLAAIIKSDGESFSINKPVSVLSSIKPKLYSYEIIASYPHDIKGYSQGLEFNGDDLYESIGQYGSSSLRKVDLTTGNIIIEKKLAKQFFGEGLTILGDKIYQLTWKEEQGLIYNLDDLEQIGSFKYNESTEGWGLANDGTKIFKSDGTQKIWTLNGKTLAEESFIEIYTNTSKINAVNELEFVDGFIYANIYQKDAIAIVDPANGAVHGVINLKGLKDQVTQHPKLDVLNGIAYKGEKDILYVTGKNWDKLFKIKIIISN